MLESRERRLKLNTKNKKLFLAPILIAFGLLLLIPIAKISAAEAKPVSIGKIDYDNLTMYVYTNNNTVVYYSTDKTTWYEVEGNKTTENDAFLMDISWVNSSDDITLYFKGENDKTVQNVTLPAKDTSLKVILDKVDNTFDFENCDAATHFEWKKANDYVWNKVPLDTKSASYQSFLKTIEGLVVKGAKISFRIPQTVGTNANNVGARPSKEVNITLAKRANAPSVKVNANKLMLNTTLSMEYFSDKKNVWIECDKNMTIEDIAPTTLFRNGSKSVTLKIRTAATTNRTYSKTAFLKINGQAGAPTIGDNSKDVSYYYQNGKLMLQFNNASKTDVYSYAIVKPGSTFNETTTAFTMMNTNKAKVITATTAPEGSTIYIRKQGINENTTKGIELELASEVNSFKVTYPKQ